MSSSPPTPFRLAHPLARSGHHPPFVPEPAALRASSRGTPSPAGVQNRPDRRIPAQFGPLARVLGDEAVTDLFVNGSGDVWVVRGHGVEPLPALRLAPREAHRLAVGLIALGGRHVDESKPTF